MTVTLEDAMPKTDFCDIYKSWKFKDIKVIKEYSRSNHGYKRWPGNHKNVHFWVILENGYAVAWNENPNRGYSFPYIKIKSH